MPTVLIEEGARFKIYAWGDEEYTQLIEFLEELKRDGNTDAERIAYLIQRTADHGIVKNKKQCREIGDDIYEFKASNGARVLWFYDEGSVIICSHGFVKKSQKTPKPEKERAIKIRQLYFEEKDNE